MRVTSAIVLVAIGFVGCDSAVRSRLPSAPATSTTRAESDTASAATPVAASVPVVTSSAATSAKEATSASSASLATADPPPLSTVPSGGNYTGTGVPDWSAKGPPVNVTVGSLQAGGLGTIAIDEADRVVRANRSRMRLCYELALSKNASLGFGRLVVRFAIDASGLVSAPTVVVAKSTFTDAKVRACVTNVFSTLAFPAPTAAVDATIAIDFTKP